ncbi:MAG: M15 family metallopeptidase [Micrococcales bacterium]|nr:M15 family metallopeptidase [Micrococcales bacterium]
MNTMMGVAGIQERMAELRTLVDPRSAPRADFATTLATVLDTTTSTNTFTTANNPFGTTTPAAVLGATTSGSYDAAAWPTVSADGTFRSSKAGSGRLDTSTLSQLSWAPSGTKLRGDAAQSLEQLDAAFFSRFGEHLKVSGGGAYRDYDAQVSLRAQKGAMAAEPGKSNHGWGLAVDINNLGGEGSTKHAWLRANAPAYGWDHPSWARVGGSKPESWHWEYVR